MPRVINTALITKKQADRHTACINLQQTGRGPGNLHRRTIKILGWSPDLKLGFNGSFLDITKDETPQVFKWGNVAQY